MRNRNNQRKFFDFHQNGNCLETLLLAATVVAVVDATAACALVVIIFVLVVGFIFVKLNRQYHSLRFSSSPLPFLSSAGYGTVYF